MLLYVWSVLLARSALAEITTSFWVPNYGESEKLGFYGSVIGASNGHVTVAFEYDNSTDMEGLRIGTDRDAGTYIIAPTLYEFSTTARYDDHVESWTYRCEMADTAAHVTEVACTDINDDSGVGARRRYCDSINTRSERVIYPTLTDTHTYGSGTWGPPGTETWVHTIYEPTTTRTAAADWCTGSGVPASALAVTETLPRESFITWQVIITAGEEKLSATTGANGATPSARPTGSQGSISQDLGTAMPTGTTAGAAASTATEYCSWVLPIFAVLLML